MRFGRVGLGILVLGPLGCHGTPRTATPQSTSSRPAPLPAIDTTRLLQTVVEFSHDGMQGRDSRDPVAIRAAAEYLARRHAEYGTRPVGTRYQHDFPLPVGSHVGDGHHFWVDLAGHSRPVPPEAFVSLAMGHARPRLGTAIYIGQGDDAAIQKQDLRRKIALVSLPRDPTEAFDLIGLPHRLASRGVAGLVLIHDGERTLEPLETSEIPVVALPRATAAELFSTFRSSDLEEPPLGNLPNTVISLAPEQIRDYADVPNVIAYVEGSERPEELVLVGAHYDHIGTVKRGLRCVPPSGQPERQDIVCNGADDNASGTALVLEIARIMASLPRPPARSIVFAHFAGEELGLLGSRALAESPPPHPPFSGGRIVAMLNFDMVGRYRDDPGLTIGAVSSSTAWESMLQRIDPRGLVVHYERAVSNRSDHANYHRRQIPVLFFFTGLHPDYHRTSDEAERVNLAGLEATTAFALELVVELGRGAPISFRAPTHPEEGETSALPGSTD